MKQKILFPALAIGGGIVGFALRLVQNRTGFEASTGLAIPGSAAGMALTALFVLAAAAAILLSWKLSKKDNDLTFPAAFPAPEAALLMPIIMGVFLMALSGLADLAIGLGLGGEAVFTPSAAGDSGAAQRGRAVPGGGELPENGGIRGHAPAGRPGHDGGAAGADLPGFLHGPHPYSLLC